jgi:hypothetical protein
MNFEDQIAEIQRLLAHAVELDGNREHDAARAALLAASNLVETAAFRQSRKAEAWEAYAG